MVHSKLLGITKVKLAGLLLGVLTSLAAGTAYPADLPISCKVVNASTVQCGGTTCIGDITIDTLGTIRCLQSVSKPTCTLTASPASISSGGTATLRASCDPAATSYVWSNGACASSAASSCTVTPSTSYTGYTVAGVNSAGTGIAAFASVTVSSNSPAPSAPAPTGPPVCNPIQSTFLGGYTRLSSNCSPVGTSYSWAGGACQGVGTENCDFTTPTATTDYSVTATNSYGAVTKNIQITVVPPLPVCTLSADKPLIGVGETSILTVTNCSPAATSYIWTGGTCAGTSAASCSVTPGTTTPYTVAGINANGTGAAASATVTVGTPICTATASALAAAAPNVTTTLTASCDRAVTQYNWTTAAPGLTAGTASTATVTLSTTPDTFTYNVNGQNSSGPGANAPVSVYVAVPSCTVAASPATINTGGTSTLTASCTPAASTYSWTAVAGLVAGTNTATFTTSEAGTYNFSVTGTNAVGPGAVSPNAAVTVSAAPVVPTSCRIIDVTWPAGSVNIYAGHITPTQTMNTGQMFAFRVSNLSTLDGSAGYAQLGYAVPGINHYLNVSANPCEFTAAIENVGCSSSGFTEPRFIYSTTGAAGAACKISSGTWYFNVKNAASVDGADTCPAGQSCTYTFNW